MSTHPTGSQVFDDLLDGGYEKGIITCIYGPAASGKSNLMLLSAATSDKKVIFVDTEGSFSVERLRQFAPGVEDRLENIMLLKATSFSQQTNIISKLPKLISEDVGLVIVDSIASQYRAAIARGEENINNQLSEQINTLFAIASEHKLPVLITSQVYADMDGDGIKVVGGDIIKYNSKCMIELRDEPREVVLIKHRFLAPNASCKFRIDSVGIYEEK